MSKLPSVTPKKLSRALEKLGFELVRVRGSHHYYYNPKSDRVAVVPFHEKDLSKNTLHKILKSAGINREEIADLI